MCFNPRVGLCRATRVLVGIVSMAIYFHASTQYLADNGANFKLAHGHGQRDRHGLFDQPVLREAQDGTLLVTSHSLVYFEA